MKYHWIDYRMPFPSDRLDLPCLHSKMLIMSSNKRLRQCNAQLMKLQVLHYLLETKKSVQIDPPPQFHLLDLNLISIITKKLLRYLRLN